MLSVILGYSELALMKMEPSQPHYAAFIEIKKAAERSANLTRQLLAFARKQTVAPKVIDLNETTDEGGVTLKEHAFDWPAKGNETILLVEDEVSILKMTALMLEGQGYTVLTAGNGREAISRFNEHTGMIHLLMTDVIMPDMNGRDLVEKLHLLSPQLKCLFMSGYTSDIIAHQGVLDEGVHFVQKPFSLPDFAVKVREVLDGNCLAMSRKVYIADIII